MSKEKYGKERQLHVLKTWLLGLKSNREITLQVYHRTSQADKRYQHIADIITLKQKLGINQNKI
jgi:hypothetical protein